MNGPLRHVGIISQHALDRFAEIRPEVFDMAPVQAFLSLRFAIETGEEVDPGVAAALTQCQRRADRETVFVFLPPASPDGIGGLAAMTTSDHMVRTVLRLGPAQVAILRGGSTPTATPALTMRRVEELVEELGRIAELRIQRVPGAGFKQCTPTISVINSQVVVTFVGES